MATTTHSPAQLISTLNSPRHCVPGPKVPAPNHPIPKLLPTAPLNTRPQPLHKSRRQRHLILPGSGPQPSPSISVSPILPAPYCFRTDSLTSLSSTEESFFTLKSYITPIKSRPLCGCLSTLSCPAAKIIEKQFKVLLQSLKKISYLGRNYT